MKNVLVLIFSLVVLTQAEATIWRVNNNTGADADFTTLQAAHDGASAGDTLMLEPSATSYGNLTAVKKIIIFGSGYFITENYPNYPNNKNSIVGTMTFESSSNDSVVMGLYTGSVTIKTSGMNISRNYGLIIGFGSITSNTVISQNYFAQINPPISFSINNLIVKNNYIFKNSGDLWKSNHEALFLNNILAGGGFWFFDGQTVTNNILICIGCALSIGLGTNSSYNLDARTNPNAGFGNENGNQGSIDPAILFVGATGNSTDSQWKLRIGSPGSGTGLGGTDCGIFGGLDPYVLSGTPPLPLITKLNQSGVGSSTTPLQVTISIESKN